MTQTNVYRNIESDVVAHQLTSETTGDIGKMLGGEAVAQLLATLHAEYSDATNCHTYKFRYKDETIDSVLSAGDYLVQLNTGKFVARAAVDFESEYINTDNDIVPIEAANPVDTFTTKMQALYVDLGIADRADCLKKLNLIVEKLRSWYNIKVNLLTLDFTNYAMVSPVELHLIINGFATATYLNKETQIVLALGNLGPASRNVRDLDRTTLNSFNFIGLQELVGELKLTKKDIRDRITSITFAGTNGAPSAVATSVTEGQWLDIIDDLRNVTGMSRNSAVKR